MGNPSRRGKAARSFIDERRQDETTGTAMMPHKRAGHMSNEMKTPNGRSHVERNENAKRQGNQA
jgi:hypothetical protein